MIVIILFGKFYFLEHVASDESNWCTCTFRSTIRLIAIDISLQIRFVVQFQHEVFDFLKIKLRKSKSLKPCWSILKNLIVGFYLTENIVKNGPYRKITPKWESQHLNIAQRMPSSFRLRIKRASLVEAGRRRRCRWRWGCCCWNWYFSTDKGELGLISSLLSNLWLLKALKM